MAAIQAKALAEAEGIDKKAEAMKRYGQAAAKAACFFAAERVSPAPFPGSGEIW